jgi:lipopolysaccharide export system permease protein
MANRGKIPPFIGVWTPNFVLFFLTFIFYRKKARGI